MMPHPSPLCSMFRTETAMEKAALALNRVHKPVCQEKDHRKDSKNQQAISTSTGCHLLMDFIDIVTDTVETGPEIIYILSFGCSRFEQLEMVRVNFSFSSSRF